MSLLQPDEPAPVLLERAGARSPFVITCDHAGQLLPRSLGDLGVSAAERARHIGWDIGALGLARELAERLDGVLVAQRYSRLVIDCNRPAASPDLICVRSEATPIPGNCAVDAVSRAARIDAIYRPYHATLRALLDGRAAAARTTIYIAVHSFTPIYAGVARPWQVGVLYGPDTRLATPLLATLLAAGDVTVGDNQPYRIDDHDHSIPEHALARGLPHVLLEIRQDLLTTAAMQAAWGERLASDLARAARAL